MVKSSRRGSPEVSLRRLSPLLRPVVSAAQSQGWRLEVSRKNHYLLRPPQGSDVVASAVVLPNTPSDHRASRNAISMLRRAGVEFTH